MGWMRKLRGDARWWMFAVAVLAGVLAAWTAQRHLHRLAAALEADARQPVRAVVVAGIDLAAGDALVMDTAAVRDVPLQWLPGDALMPEDFDMIDGARLGRAVARGEIVLWSHLEAPRQEPFSARLAEGRRAVTIAVDEINSLSGMLEPGDVIDLYVSFDHQARRITALLLQGVRVLATGRQYAGGVEDGYVGAERGFATLTLDASPDDAVRLVAARQQGTISAMLRRAGDPGPSVTAGGDLAALLGLDAPAPPPPVPAREIPVIFGDQAPRAIPRLGATAPPAPIDDVGFEADLRSHPAGWRTP